MMLNRSFAKFMADYEIKEVDSCTVLSALDPILMFRIDYVVCTK